MKPYGDNILIKREESVSQVGMIILAETRYVSKSKACYIVAVGAKVKDPDYKAGKRCLVSELDGMEIPGKPNHYMVKPDMIIAIIEDSEVKVEAVRNKPVFNKLTHGEK